MSAYDVVIRNGTILDGTGEAPFHADLGITGHRITALGTGAISGKMEIDATDLVVCPGFIDLHSHADYTIESAPEATTQIHQGVTTLVTGNCGWSPFPVQDLPELQRWSTFLGPDLSWSWTDLQGFAQAVDRARPTINIAPQVGHVTVRLAVMGSSEREPTDSELRDMVHFVHEAADQGAWGLSSGLIYAPGSFAQEREMRALVAAATAADLLYSTHMRDETSSLLHAVDEAIAAVEDCGGRLEISHLKAMGPANHGMLPAALARIDAARARGVDVAADVYPYTASGTTLVSRTPTWSQDGGIDALLERLGDPLLRARISREIQARVGVDIDLSGIVISELSPGRFNEFVGRSVADIADVHELDGVELMLQILEAHSGVVPIINHSMSPADVDAALGHPHVSVASDGAVMSAQGQGSTHPRSFGTFPRVLGRNVRESKRLQLPEAIRKMTSLPAARLHMRDRGVLGIGRVADIVVFDAGTILDHSTYADPWQLSSGVHHVLVSGVPVMLDQKPTRARPGRVLLKRQGTH
ncbi:amidohydrolase family protein [Paenarthrobacter sp. AMU7]|uniref:Amidohydrolase family protein n=1 Tax=Paenarthrobacter sp. AMU7 TaxID=3162492 RepID=A0AB39YRB7_9MICC